MKSLLGKASWDKRRDALSLTVFLYHVGIYSAQGNHIRPSLMASFDADIDHTSIIYYFQALPLVANLLGWPLAVADTERDARGKWLPSPTTASAALAWRTTLGLEVRF